METAGRGCGWRGATENWGGDVWSDFQAGLPFVVTRTMKLKTRTLMSGLFAGLVGSASLANAHSIIVDMDPVTPGFQTAIAVPAGTVVMADIHLVDDGVTPISGYGLATNFNDTPGTLALMPPTVAGPGVLAVGGPLDLVAGVPTGVGVPLAPAGVLPFGFGPGGPFLGSDGGAGYYDAGGFAWPGMPGLGGTIILETVTFTAIGPVGTFSDVAPLGIIMPGAPGGGVAVPPILPGPGGVEFYDAGIGSYGAVGFAPGANPLFPGGLPAMMPGTVGIIPEPSVSLLGALGFAGLLLRRKR